MDTGGSGELGESADAVLDFLSALHHEVGELVDDDDDIGEAVLEGCFFVPSIDVADSGGREFVVSAVHFPDDGPEDSGGFFDVFDDGAHEVG